MNQYTLTNELRSHQSSSDPITPESSAETGSKIRRTALMALREFYHESHSLTPTLFDSIVAEVETKVQALRQDLQYEDANAIEMLVIEQILTAWVQWYVAGLLLDAESTGNRTWRQNQYFDQRYQMCQSRLSRAIDQLTRIRQIPESCLILEPKAIREDRALRLRIKRKKFDDTYLPKLPKSSKK